MNKKPSIKNAILKVLSRKSVISLESVKSGAKESLFFSHTVDPKTDYAITRSLKNLVSAGLIEVFNSEHDQYLRLTALGKQEAQTLSIEGRTSLVSINWDGMWRMILLDLPEARKNERESLRYLLKKAGFVCLKNSVWVSPHPFEHMFTNLKNDLGLTTEMIIIVTAAVDSATDKELKDSFGIL